MVKRRPPDTRARLIDATLALVAERGFDGVSVGDIEAGAGLAPRSGALYKYFPSKLAVLEAGVERHLAAVAELEVDQRHAPQAGDATEIAGVIRWLLAELDAERTMTQVIEREGDRLPELRDRMRAGTSDRGYRIAAASIQHWVGPTARGADHEALAVILIGAIVNFRRSAWTFGAPPLGLDDERFVDAFVQLGTALLALGRAGAEVPAAASKASR
jgi:AcrR family transcriptional regulator